ncbi:MULTISPECIES: ketoacyl-ACP synthase III [Dethiosulfovibrio]|uniref:Ketoacyl-ACP synthase III n=2 Tax=Dethiosulfovibrio TaxID=47054 RepID=A0ABS9EPE9_9BACT|nr:MULTISPECIES: ketoacyl-ACP synthase III [Dethiosulfovibrio]MCF4114732.1 ketoacyl-ACP synthase III [Dethiosulfovibrio russensis]MCF4143063.1 ketoacyl-ACP synthase III [Dethiosulfovibrio marinus]MCF4145237.1 ketoacyl-ACP synthase III [Dethiosulfovibrio acidaminovorans]
MERREAAIAHVSYHLPERKLTNRDLVEEFGTWTEHKIKSKTGIDERRIAGEDETASVLATVAAERLFQESGIPRESVDMLLLCTETPDYIMPSTACIVHDKLGLRKDCGALDYNLGCSGYVYGLYMASAMVRSGMAEKVLLITGDVLTRYVHPGDKSTRTIFGDGFTATLVSSEPKEVPGTIGSFVLGTDGTGHKDLIIPAGGTVSPCCEETKELYTNRYGNSRTKENLYMNGPEVFAFAVREVPPVIERCLADNGISMEEIDLFVFHQATHMMLEKLREIMEIPEERFVVDMEETGNTVSSSIPLALKRAQTSGRLKKGDTVLVCGFGVGYSWGATVIQM